MEMKILNKPLDVSLLCLVVQMAFMSNTAYAGDGCPDAYFLLCVTKLRLQRVPFDQNMLNVVFNVTSEAKLRQTCIAYTDALPCFRDKILQCGNDKQKQLLDEVAKMIIFFCSPNSAKRQEDFLRHGPCIGKVLQMPATTDCYNQEHQEYAKIEQCRKICYDKREFLCMMKIWVSEQNFCTLLDIERNCGQEAGVFYQQLQTNVFSDTFPIICDYSVKNVGQIVSSDSTFVDSIVDPRDFFENPNKVRTPHLDPMVVPTLPASIPVVYQPKSRPAEPQPVKLPTYLPVNPAWKPETNFNIVEVTVTVTEPSGSLPPNSPNMWIPAPKKGMENKYPFDQPLPDSTQVRLTTPAQWKPWYLGGSPNSTQGENENSSPRRRLLLADENKSTLWDSLKMSNIFDFGQQIIQNTNKLMTRKDADASYRSSQWNGSSKINKVNAWNFAIVMILSLLIVR